MKQMQKSGGIRQKSLSRTLALYLVLILTLSSAAVLVLGTRFLAWNTELELERKMEEYREFLPWILAPALWDMNDTLVGTVSQVFTQNEFITLLAVRNSFGAEVYFFQRPGEVSSTIREMEILQDGYKVGSLTLGLGKKYFQSLSDQIFRSFAGVFLFLGILVSVGSSLVIRSVISRPFEVLGRLIKEYEPGQTGAFQSDLSYRETDPLVDRLNAMGETIAAQVRLLQESEFKFRTLMETSPIPMAISDVRGRIEKLNQVFTELLGYTLEDIPDITAWSLLAYPDPAQRQLLFQDWEMRIRESVTTGEPFRPMEVTILAKDRTVRHLEIRHVVMGDFSLTTFQDLTERKKNEEALQKALGELEAKNSEMERYLYTVSHDLKSPLVTIKGYAGYLEKALTTLGLQDPLKDLGRIQKAADRASLLLEDLLHLSRVGQGTSTLTTVSSEEILKEVLEAFEPELDRLGVQFEISGIWPEVWGDRPRLLEVWQNLVENALKYRDPIRPLRLHFECKILKGIYHFSLQDNGMGIEQAYIHKIFDIFEKIDPKSEGSGIGLAIVRRIVEHHGGQIWAHSDGTGKGVTVFFTLPRRE